MINAPALQCLQRTSYVCKTTSLTSGKCSRVETLNLSPFVSQAPFAALLPRLRLRLHQEHACIESARNNAGRRKSTSVLLDTKFFSAVAAEAAAAPTDAIAPETP